MPSESRAVLWPDDAENGFADGQADIAEQPQVDDGLALFPALQGIRAFGGKNSFTISCQVHTLAGLGSLC